MVVTSTIQPMAVRPRNGTMTDTAMINRMALRGARYSFSSPNQSGSILSLAIAYKRRLEAI